MRYVKKKEVPNSPYIDIIYTCTIPSMYTVIERFNGGGEVKETYTLFTEIGHGITSRVYRVHEDPFVVIKVFLSHIDFGAERRIITRMMPSDTKVYKGTVQSMDSGEYGILMHLCTPIHISLHPGKSRLLEMQCSRYARQLLEQLARVHGACIIHNDVKSNNILLNNDGEAVLVDYSHSVVTEPTLFYYGQEKNEDGVILCGNYIFQSPEVLIMVEQSHKKNNMTRSGEKLFYTPKSDIFSLGCTLYYWLCDEFPFGNVPSCVKNIPLIMDCIYAGEYVNSLRFKRLHPITQEFMNLLLQPERVCRPTAKDALTHPFVNCFVPHAKMHMLLQY